MVAVMVVALNVGVGGFSHIAASSLACAVTLASQHLRYRA